MKIIDLYVVVSNEDPYNASRVRAYPLKSLNRTGDSPVRLLEALDTTGQYTPWQKSDVYGKVNDPYCFEPFLPKHINIIPKQGDLIKIISYEDNSNMPQEYVIVNSGINDISTDTYRTADKFHTNNKKRIDPDNSRSTIPGFNPNYNDIGLLSGKNSEVVLNEGRLILKAGHQKISSNNVRQINNHQATINLHMFKTGYDYQDVETTIVTPIRTPINSLVEYQLYDYSNDNAIADGKAFAFRFDIRIQLFQNQQYIDTLPSTITNPEVNFVIFFNDRDKFISAWKKILTQLEEKKLDYRFGLPSLTYDSANDLSYRIQDNRIPIGGVMPDNSINMGTKFYIRQSLTQEYITELGNNLITRITNSIQTTGGNLRPKVVSPNTISEKTSVRQLKKTSTPETTIISGADTQFILSWLDNDYIKFNHDEFINQQMIYGKNGLIDTTEPLVRGNQLLVVLSKLVDLLLEHGHQNISDSRNTIDNISIESLNKIKTTILNISSKEKQLKIDGKDINDSLTNLINHHIRIN